ncbi:hypothetical protein ACROYT_G020169 [Oculina patagonica]
MGPSSRPDPVLGHFVFNAFFHTPVELKEKEVAPEEKIAVEDYSSYSVRLVIQRSRYHSRRKFSVLQLIFTIQDHDVSSTANRAVVVESCAWSFL